MDSQQSNSNQSPVLTEHDKQEQQQLQAEQVKEEEEEEKVEQTLVAQKMELVQSEADNQVKDDQAQLIAPIQDNESSQGIHDDQTEPEQQRLEDIKIELNSPIQNKEPIQQSTINNEGSKEQLQEAIEIPIQEIQSKDSRQFNDIKHPNKKEKQENNDLQSEFAGQSIDSKQNPVIEVSTQQPFQEEVPKNSKVDQHPDQQKEERNKNMNEKAFELNDQNITQKVTENKIEAPTAAAKQPLEIIDSQKKQLDDSKQFRQIASVQLLSQHQFFLDWDSRRISVLNKHRGITEGIFTRVDQHMKKSGDNLAGIIVFMRSIIATSNSRNIGSIRNSLSTPQTPPIPFLYSNLREAIHLYDIHVIEINSLISTFSTTVEEAIVKEMLLPQKESHTRTISLTKRYIEGIKQRILEIQDSLIDKKKRVLEVYLASTQNKRAKKDSQLKIFEYLRECSNLQEQQCVLSKSITEYWWQALELEINHAKAIKQALDKLIQLNMDLTSKRKEGTFTFLTESIIEEIQKQDFSDSHIQSKLSFHEIVPVQDQQSIVSTIQQRTITFNRMREPSTNTPATTINTTEVKLEEQQQQQHLQETKTIPNNNNNNNRNSNVTSSNKKVDISIREVHEFLMKIEIPSFDDSQLTLARFNVNRIEGNSKKRSLLVITPDLFLVCFDSPEHLEESKESDDGDDEEYEKKERQSERIAGTANAHSFWMLNIINSFLIKNTIISQNDLALEIKAVEHSSLLMSFLRSTETKIKITFNSHQQLQEFTRIIIAVYQEN